RGCTHEFNACCRPRAARDEKTRPRLRDLERDGRERAFRIVAELFESADPVIALVTAPHVIASRENGIAFDRLALKRLAGSGPVLERDVFEIEIDRLAVGTHRADARCCGSGH